MEGDTTDLLRQLNLELDKGMAGVMPDKWEGHGRIAIRESDTIPESAEDKAIEKMAKLVEQNDKAPARAANDLIRAIQAKQD